MGINGKVFVVTGGGNGIGQQVVLALLAKGADVAAVDRNEAALAATTDLAHSARLTTHALDITDREQVLALPDTVLAEHGVVDGLVNVAGIVQHFVPVADLDFAEIEKVMGVNFWGTVNMTKAFLPLLLQRPRAALVNVSSMGALVPVPGQSAYGASKAAVKLFTEGLYAELHETNVNVTVVFPGAIATNIVANSGVSMPGMSTDASGSSVKVTSAEEAARQIVRAIETGAPRVLIGNDAKMLDLMGRVMPRRAILTIANKMKDLST